MIQTTAHPTHSSRYGSSPHIGAFREAGYPLGVAFRVRIAEELLRSVPLVLGLEVVLDSGGECCELHGDGYYP